MLKDVSENNLIYQSIGHISNLSSESYNQEGIDPNDDDELIETRIFGSKNKYYKRMTDGLIH